MHHSPTQGGSSRDPWRVRTLQGAIAGALATVTMTAAMLMLQRAGLLGKMPPRLIVQRLLTRLGVEWRLPVGADIALTSGAHLGFGATQGAVYACLLHFAARRAGRGSLDPSATTAVAFALAIWAVSYAGWIPAIGLMRDPVGDRPGRPTAMVLSHVVFGLTLGRALRLLEQRHEAGNIAQSQAQQPGST